MLEIGNPDFLQQMYQLRQEQISTAKVEARMIAHKAEEDPVEILIQTIIRFPQAMWDKILDKLF